MVGGGPLVACHQADGLWLLKKSSAVEYSVVDKFLLLRTAQSGNIWFNKLEIKREKRKEIRKSSPLGLNIGQKYLNVATTPHHGPLHLPHMKFNPFGLLTEHLLCQMGLTQFPATCCGPAVTLRLPPSHPPGGDDGLLLKATLGATTVLSVPVGPGATPASCSQVSGPPVCALSSTSGTQS